MMNRYEEALTEFKLVTASQKEDKLSRKYKAKALDNFAITKCMSGNFKQALEAIDRPLDGLTFIDKVKHKIKLACVFKKSSFYKKAYELLV